MKLPESRENDNAITRETNCRIWWTLYMADRWCSAGSGLPRQMCDNDDGKVSLPIEEHVFQDVNFGTLGARTRAKPGLWAYKITLVQMFARIQDLHRHVAEGAIEQKQIDERVSELAVQLDDWEQQLPEPNRFSSSTLQVYRERGLGGTFIDMHLGFHYYATLLFFIYLDVQRPLTLDTSQYSQMCKQHALQFSQLLEISRKTPGCEAVHATVGHMTVVSSAVLVHTLLFEEEPKRSASRDRLLSNFETLLQLQKLWPSMNSLVCFCRSWVSRANSYRGRGSSGSKTPA